MAERAPLRLVQFTREPVPGRVKTRMQPDLTPQQSRDLHCELTLRTLRTLCSVGAGTVELCVAGDSRHPFFTECTALGDVVLTTQQDGDLGARMHAALSANLATARKVVLVGSDCPGLDASYILEASAELDAHDVVLGPASDGGYVLIGVTELRGEWFDNIEWGSGAVFDATVAALRATGARFATLAPLADIDRPADLELWRSIRAGETAVQPEPAGSGAEGG